MTTSQGLSQLGSHNRELWPSLLPFLTEALWGMPHFHRSWTLRGRAQAQLTSLLSPVALPSGLSFRFLLFPKGSEAKRNRLLGG